MEGLSYLLLLLTDLLVPLRSTVTCSTFDPLLSQLDKETASSTVSFKTELLSYVVKQALHCSLRYHSSQ